jgi:hypothetical protein
MLSIILFSRTVQQLSQHKFYSCNNYEIRNFTWFISLVLLFQTGSSSSPTYFHIFYFVAFLEKVLIRNIIIILRTNYVVKIYINNKAVISNNLGKLQGLYWFFKIPMGTGKDFFENL